MCFLHHNHFMLELNHASHFGKSRRICVSRTSSRLWISGVKKPLNKKPLNKQLMLILSSSLQVPQQLMVRHNFAMCSICHWPSAVTARVDQPAQGQATTATLELLDLNDWPTKVLFADAACCVTHGNHDYELHFIFLE